MQSSRSSCSMFLKRIVYYLWIWMHSALTVVAQEQQSNRIGSSSSSYAPYNVVVIIFDDLRPVIGGYGDRLAKTPYLNGFMNESFVFTRAYSQQSLCAPSRNSLLTSRRPDTLRLYDFYSYWRTFAGNFTTLPQYFKEHGYNTYSAGKIFHPGVSSNNTDDYPLSWSSPTFRPKTEKFMNSPVCPDPSGILRKNLICPVHLQTQPFKTLPDIESVNDAIRFVQSRENQSRKQQQQQPYFLALGFHKPHINFRFPIQFLDYFYLSDFYNYTEDTMKPYDMPSVAWNPYTDVRSRDDFKNMNISFPYGPISVRQSAQIRQAYYASVAYVDDLFGKFMAHINGDRTIVMVTSDHGWSLGEHAEWAKYSNFEVALRVPLIIRSPEFPLNKPSYIDSITELLDIFPTLVDLAHLPRIPKCNEQQSSNGPTESSGSSESESESSESSESESESPESYESARSMAGSPLACTEGKSLYTQMNGIGRAEQYVAVSQYPRPGIQPTKHPNSDKPKLKNIKVMGYSLRTQNYRYTLWTRFHAQNFTKDWSCIYGEELYDHRSDSGEETNLVELHEFDEIRLKLRRKLINTLG